MAKRGIRIILSAFLGLFLLFPASSDALARESSPDSLNESDVVILDENASCSIAESFIEGVYPDIDIEASRAIPFCDSSGTEIGYIVNFSYDDRPYGYVIVDTSVDSLIAEYSIGDSAVSPADAALGNATDLSAEDDAPAVIKLSPIEYGVIDADDESVVTNEGVEGSLEEVTDDALSSARAKDPAKWDDATIPIASLYRNYTITSRGNLDEFYSINETEIEKRTKRYACSVSAYYAIAGYYGVLNLWNDFPEYTNIWIWTKTYTKKEEKGVTYGETPIDDGAAGFVRYLSSKGVKVSQTTTSGKPDFNKYKTSINSGNPCVMHGWLINPKNGEVEGHTMFVEGFVTAAEKSNPSRGLCILQVFDGWEDNVRYINYDFKNYVNFRGTFFTRR
ncbi:hypothetical protein [Denitrobacterium detoxificans]|uniref:hypothetical protein n=1 Tax=Denitrobacterium detoxificans TaxID=79604 RepID=UPI0026EDB055|nr:hypothetical protein [Denitrobacterium detoxificans]MBE6465867.1 hypothetical protein [Denitrobacterium detoxificans]